MVTLYFEVELSRDKRPGTEQNRSVGLTTQVPPIYKRNVKAEEISYSVFSNEELTILLLTCGCCWAYLFVLRGCGLFFLVLFFAWF